MSDMTQSKASSTL